MSNEPIGASWEPQAEEAVKQLNAEILERAGTCEYSGWCSFLIKNNLSEFGVIHYYYGSCSHCDPFGNLSAEEVVTTIKDEIMWYKTETDARVAYINSQGW